MNRLAPRLALAMIATTVLSLLILLASVGVAERSAYNALPEVRAQVPPPRLSVFRGPPPRDLSGEQARSFTERRAVQERALFVGVLVAGGLTMLLALLLSRSIARPIEAASRAATGAAAGDFGARVPLSERQQRSSLETARLAVTFNRMSEALEGYERERKAMVADIAHELRTPLTAPQMRLEALQDGLVPLSAGQVEHLLTQTGLLSRLADAGRLTLLKQPTDLRDLAAEVLEGFAERARQGGEARALRCARHPGG